jgi:hypothetical protein
MAAAIITIKTVATTTVTIVAVAIAALFGRDLGLV